MIQTNLDGRAVFDVHLGRLYRKGLKSPELRDFFSNKDKPVTLEEFGHQHGVSFEGMLSGS